MSVRNRAERPYGTPRETMGYNSHLPRRHYPDFPQGFDFDFQGVRAKTVVIKDRSTLGAVCIVQMRLIRPINQKRNGKSAFTIVEVVISASILLFCYISLYFVMGMGWSTIKNTREDL